MKSFKERFEDYKLQVSGLSSLADDSFNYWVNNFANKVHDEFNPYNFLSGKIYSFEYVDQMEKGKKFINKRPIVFFTGFFNPMDKSSFNGIDLILMPPIMRILFLTRIQSVFQSQIDTNSKRIENGEPLGQLPLKTDYETLNAILTGISFKNAYRVWDLKKIRGIKEIPYEDWTRIVYLHTRSIEGSQIEEIYKKNAQI